MKLTEKTVGCRPKSRRWSVRSQIVLIAMVAAGLLHCSSSDVAEGLGAVGGDDEQRVTVDGQRRGASAVDSAAIYTRRGRRHMKEQAYGRAIEELSRALRVNPEAHEALDMLGLAYAFKLEPGKAIEHIEQAIAMAPENGSYQMHLGKAYMLLTDYDGATTAYERAIEMGLKKGKPYYDLGIIAEREGRLDDARSYFEKAIEVAPRFAPSCNLRLGIIAEKTGDDKRAIALYTRALKGDAGLTIGHYRIAQQHLRQGREDLAERHLEKFRQLKAAERGR